jgi:hypothetical protein
MANWMPIIEPRIRDHIRIIIDNSNRLCPVFWLEVGDDGSVYFGIRRKNPPVVKEGSKLMTGPTVNIGYNEGKPIEDKRTKKNTKISYHSSGIVNFPNKRFSINSLRELNEIRLVAVLLFEELDKFPIITKKKITNEDVVFKFENVSNAGPLVGQLYVMPLRNKLIQDIRPIVIKNSVSQYNICFIYTNLMKCNDFVIQLILFNTSSGTWPPYSYIVMKEYLS